MSTPTPDDLYEHLVRLHDGLDTEASLFVSQRLILLLCERIGDPDAVRDLIAEARRGVELLPPPAKP
ncbi:DUF2783 domain-containing protein [Arenibaculum sp.]|jgi:hypothetical protein|uniref:DUF2783 domain-containing protein n=1 Tax=Arenibaculum sp. TaxID=2865862 RepID=UPI002E0E63F9|nr:DUF2783 domain-containing protein [Arenibaculum sp.]